MSSSAVISGQPIAGAHGPRAYQALALAILAAFAAWALMLGEPVFPLDDAYITLHNADVLLRGRDANYGVSPLVGSTSTVHLALVSAFAAILGTAWGAALVSWGAIYAYLAGLLFAARRSSLTATETGLLLVAGAFCGMSVFHLLNGLETGLAMAVVLWSMLLAVAGGGRRLVALLALAPFVRPELAVLSLALGLDHAWQRWHRGERRALAGDALLAGALAAPWLAWMWSETGALVPQTMAAKRDFFAEAALPLPLKLWHAAQCVSTVLLHAGPLALGVLGLVRLRAGRAALLAGAAIIALFAAYFPGGLHHNHYRYLYGLLPLLPLGLAAAMAQARAGERRWLSAALAACALWSLAPSPEMLGRYADRLAFTRTELAGLADWLKTNLPAGAPLAIHDAGFLAYASERHLVDIVGLKTPSAHAVHAKWTAPSGGARRSEALDRILTESRAEILVVWREWENYFAFTAGIAARGWTIELLREGAYRVWRVTPPAMVQPVPGTP